jgi:hypothetical protein
MRTYGSNQQFYDHIDEVVAVLKSAGQVEIANQIDFLLHKVAWTTTSELFGELRDRFEQALKSPTPLPSTIEIELKGFIATIDQAWEQANGAA